jgi:hypothetical protein
MLLDVNILDKKKDRKNYIGNRKKYYEKIILAKQNFFVVEIFSTSFFNLRLFNNF